MPVSENWLDAQHGVLGSVLISSELVPKVMAETSESDFQGSCLTVYKAIKKLFLAGTAVDPISILHVLGNPPEYRDYLMQLMEITPSAANIDTYIRLCREQSRIAAAQTIGAQLMGVSTSEEARNLLEKAGSLLSDRQTANAVTMADALRSFMERHSGTANYLSWPIRELNDELYVEPGDFIIIGGRPSTGKSAFALQCGWHWAQKMKVGFFSLETSDKKLFDRKMSGLAEIPMRSIKRNRMTEDQWCKVATMNQEIISTNLEIIPASGMSVTDIRAKTLMRGYQLIIIDYLQLICAQGKDRFQQVTNISLSLHTMAQSMGVTVVALCQLSRLGQNERPTMNDLRESGQIEQDADVIMLLSLEKKDKPQGPRILDVAKNKEGECPYITLAFDGKHQTFSKLQLLDQMVDANETAKAALGKKKRRKTSDEKLPEQSESPPEQFTMLPDDEPVPFRE